MLQIHRLSTDSSFDMPLVLTIGNFDGVHRGHQALLASAKEKALSLGAESAVLSFFPHPKALLTGEMPALITPFRERAFWLERYGLSHWFVLGFRDGIRRLSPEAFVACFLKKALNIAHLIVGDDFRFGYRGVGDLAWLQEREADLGFGVSAVSSVLENHLRVSSSRIRQALAAHDIAGAQALLGHDLSVIAPIRHGAGRGKVLGFPTANLHLPVNWCCSDGVYVVKISPFSVGRAQEAAQQTGVWGVANIGAAPTFSSMQRKLEVHALEPCALDYGQLLRVEVKHFLRPTRSFPNPEALCQQITQDITLAREYIAQFS